jgi:hypothetical protein
MKDRPDKNRRKVLDLDARGAEVSALVTIDGIDFDTPELWPGAEVILFRRLGADA